MGLDGISTVLLSVVSEKGWGLREFLQCFCQWYQGKDGA